jgi:hypothetical protein
MKSSISYLFAKIKYVRPDAVTLVVLLPLIACVGLVPLILSIVLGKVAISKASVDLASIIGGITGPVLTFLTLAFVLLNNLSDSQEKLFQQTLDFLERLLKVYTEVVNKYEVTGKKKQVFDENGIPMESNIDPYLRTTEPLFAVVMQHLKLTHFSKLQRDGLLSIVYVQLRPLVVTMRGEKVHLDRHMSRDYNQIAERQLTEIDNLLATAKQ